jgi:hypothetical protein
VIFMGRDDARPGWLWISGGPVQGVGTRSEKASHPLTDEERARIAAWRKRRKQRRIYVPRQAGVSQL